MCQAVLSPNLTKKFQWEVSQIANNRFPCVMLLGGLSVNLNHLKNQIKIAGGSVLLYVGQHTTVVNVDLYLPAQVTMVIIHKFGQEETFCFATVGGRTRCTLRPGDEMTRNPHKKRL